MGRKKALNTSSTFSFTQNGQLGGAGGRGEVHLCTCTGACAPVCTCVLSVSGYFVNTGCHLCMCAYAHVVCWLQLSLCRLSSQVCPGLGGQSPSTGFLWGWGGESVGSDLGSGGGADRLAALGRISLSGWHQRESDNCSQIDKSFLQNGLAG